MMRRGIACTALALLAMCGGCSERNPVTPPTNADERLADKVMDAIEKSDMRPVVRDFVPARKAILLDAAYVRNANAYISSAGTFLGARELHETHDISSRTVYFTAFFERGLQPVSILYDNDGKIVHYKIGSI